MFIFQQAASIITNLGFGATTEIYDKLTDVEFVGLKFYRSKTGVINSYRDPKRVFSKIGFTVNTQCATSKGLLASTYLGKAVSLLNALGPHKTI